jgi:FkbM family methyltransferase
LGKCGEQQLIYKLLFKIFRFIGRKILLFAEKFDESSFSVFYKKWREIDGDSTLRLNYELDSKSLVVDLGGYKGQWASDIYSKYQCNILIFEPVQYFFENIQKRFSKNSNIKVYQFGLSDKSGAFEFSIDSDSTSQFIKNNNTETCEVREAVGFFLDQRIEYIDLMKINIEGAEYDLLEHFIETGFIEKINNLQVQFHSFVPNASARMNHIRERLKCTHTPTYQYEFIWEGWVKNNQKMALAK